MGLLAELRRRNVVRAGLAWLALSWLLVAIAVGLFPYLGMPQAAIRALLLGLLVALPVVLGLAWRYEVTDRGVRRISARGGPSSDRTRTGRRLDQLTIVLVLLALSLSAVRQFVVPAAVDGRGDEMARSEARDEAAGEAPAAPAELAPHTPLAEHSLAVLPFSNLSTDPNDAFLADGVAEEILNALARVDGLHVVSRTSSFAFRDRQLGAREMGPQLGVNYLLDGSLRRQGGQVRVSLQLVDVRRDQTLWSGSLDRQLSDLFSLQQDVAQSVVDALSEQLGMRTVTVRQATLDMAAYELYLRGRQLFALRGGNLESARALLQQAVERDPGFAEAWATLGATLYVMPTYSPENAGVLATAATEAVERALALLPEQADALAVRARLSADNGERLRALRLIEQALRQEPNNANSWTWKGLTLLETGHIRSAREAFAQAQRLDPLSGIHYGWLGVTELIHGETTVAAAHLERARDLGWRGAASAWLMRLALQQGDTELAARRYAEWLRDDRRITPAALPVHERVASAVTDPAQRSAAAQILADAVQANPDYDWTLLMLFLGLTDQAMTEALRPKPPAGQILLMMIWSPADRAFLAHPRFSELAAQRGLPAFWAEHGPPDGCTWQAAPAASLACEP